METFFVTFGKNHVHPKTGDQLHHHWIEVLAADLAEARNKIVNVLGDAWGWLYDIDSFDDQFYANGLYEIIK